MQLIANYIRKLNSSVKDWNIDFGVGANQVNALDIPIIDSGALITATTVEAALQEIFTSDLSNIKKDGSVAFNNLSYLQWRNAADSADINVLTVDGTDNTNLLAASGKEIRLFEASNSLAVFSSTGLVMAVNKGITLSGTADLTLARNPTAALHAATKEYVDTVTQGLDFQSSVISFWDASTGLPIGPTTGNRYICSGSGNGWTIHYIYEYGGASWIETIPTEGSVCWVEADDVLYLFNGTIWVKFGSTVTHTNLSGLQGGATGEYYHLTNAEYTNNLLKTGSVADLSDVTSAGSGIIITSTERTNFGTAYTHSGLTTGNPHQVSAANVGLGNVSNVADANQTSVGALTSGSLAAGFTAVADAQIASATNWNAAYGHISANDPHTEYLLADGSRNLTGALTHTREYTNIYGQSANGYTSITSSSNILHNPRMEVKSENSQYALLIRADMATNVAGSTGFVYGAIDIDVERSDGSAVTSGNLLYITNNDVAKFAIDYSGAIITGAFKGTAIADTYVASAATWNAKQDALTFGIANTNAVRVTVADVATGEYARFNATGLESRTIGEIKTDLSLTKSDVGLANVDNVADASQTSVGALTAGSLTTGFTPVADALISSATNWSAAYTHSGLVVGNPHAVDASQAVVPNATYIQWKNALGTVDIDVLSVDANDDTIINALNTKDIVFKVNGATRAHLDSSFNRWYFTDNIQMQNLKAIDWRDATGAHSLAIYRLNSTYAYIETNTGSIRLAPAVAVDVNSKKITSLANGTVATDACAYGQLTGFVGSANIVTVGALTSGSLSTGFTAIADAQISSATTWNAKVDGAGAISAVNAAGLSLAATKVYSSASGNTAHKFGYAMVGYNGTSSWASFAQESVNVASSYALMQNSSGRTKINAATGQSIQLTVNNAAEMLKIEAAVITAAVPLAMGSNKITGLAAATVAGDAVRFEQMPTVPITHVSLWEHIRLGNWAWASTDEYISETLITMSAQHAYVYLDVPQNATEIKIRIYQALVLSSAVAGRSIRFQCALQKMEDGGTWTQVAAIATKSLTSDGFGTSFSLASTNTMSITGLINSTVCAHYRLDCTHYLSSTSSVTSCETRLYGVTVE